MSQTARVPRVFVSYASQNSNWLSNFLQDRWFKSQLGEASLYNYKETTNFGSISDSTRRQLEQANSMLAFISSYYITSKNTLEEWELALDLNARRGLVLVPVIMDDHGKSWWDRQKAPLDDRSTGAGGASYAYADFRHRSGDRPLDIITADGPVDDVTNKIGALARQIADKLRERALRPGGQPDGRSPSPPDAGVLGSGEDETEEGSGEAQIIHTGPRPVVILGHPTSVMRADVTAQADALRTALMTRGIQPHRWGDQWADLETARQNQEMARQNGLFVQPAAPREAVSWGKGGELGEWLDDAVADSAAPSNDKPGHRLLLWLPKDLPDQTFANLCATAPGNANPMPRHDSPADLADVIRQQSGLSLGRVPVMAIETLDPNPILVALRQGCEEALAPVVEPPPDPWPFAGKDILEKQLSVIDGARAIVAIHTLNTGPPGPPSPAATIQALKAVESKIEGYQQVAEHVPRRAGSKLNLFWIVMVVDKFDILPFVTWPGRKFPNVTLLQFRGVRDTVPTVMLEPEWTKHFRGRLRVWLDA